MVETTKACEVDIFNYLKYILLNAPTNRMTDEELEKLSSWNPECNANVKHFFTYIIWADALVPVSMFGMLPPENVAFT